VCAEKLTQKMALVPSLWGQGVTSAVGLSMPKPHRGDTVSKLHGFRGKNVQAAHAEFPKCAGCTGQVGTNVCTCRQTGAHHGE
jgi:hypothetical protein